MLWFLWFHVAYRCCLIFWNALVHFLFIFWGQNPHSYTFVCCRFPRYHFPVLYNFPSHILLPRVLRTLFMHLFSNSILFWWSLWSFSWFCCSDWCLFVLGKNRCVTPICICSFCFVRVFFAIVCACAFDTFICKHFSVLNRPKLWLLPSLFGFLVSPKLD